MKKFRVLITEVLEKEIEIEAENFQAAIHELRMARDEAEKTIRGFATEELSAKIYDEENDDEKEIRFI